MGKVYVLSLVLSCIVVNSVANAWHDDSEENYTNIFDDIVNFILDLFDYDSSEEDKTVVTCKDCTISVIVNNKTELAMTTDNSTTSTTTTMPSTTTNKSRTEG